MRGPANDTLFTQPKHETPLASFLFWSFIGLPAVCVFTLLTSVLAWGALALAIDSRFSFFKECLIILDGQANPSSESESMAIVQTTSRSATKQTRHGANNSHRRKN